MGGRKRGGAKRISAEWSNCPNFEYHFVQYKKNDQHHFEQLPIPIMNTNQPFSANRAPLSSCNCSLISLSETKPENKMQPTDSEHFVALLFSPNGSFSCVMWRTPNCLPFFLVEKFVCWLINVDLFDYMSPNGWHERNYIVELIGCLRRTGFATHSSFFFFGFGFACMGHMHSGNGPISFDTHDNRVRPNVHSFGSHVDGFETVSNV